MFRATMCPSSGENTVPMRHLVFVTVYTVWYAGRNETPLLTTQTLSRCSVLSRYHGVPPYTGHYKFIYVCILSMEFFVLIFTKIRDSIILGT